MLFLCTISLALLASCTISVSNRLVYLTAIGLSHAMARPLPIHRAELFSWPTHRRCSSVIGFLPFGHALHTRGISWPYADHTFDSRVFRAGRRVDVQYDRLAASAFLLVGDTMGLVDGRWVWWMVGGDSVG